MDALWGPFYFALDVAPINQATGYILIPILALGLLAFPVRPGRLTLAVSIVSAALWVFCGVIGRGINC